MTTTHAGCQVDDAQRVTSRGCLAAQYDTVPPKLCRLLTELFTTAAEAAGSPPAPPLRTSAAADFLRCGMACVRSRTVHARSREVEVPVVHGGVSWHHLQHACVIDQDVQCQTPARPNQRPPPRPRRQSRPRQRISPTRQRTRCPPPALPAPSFRPVAATEAPSFAKSFATVAPIPEEAPSV